MKNTKKALLMSVLALVLCFSMLVGTTFAWFTDVATTGVNNIQSGTLDVVLEYWDGTEWVDAEGKPLNFIAKDGNTDILWEPGCTYELPQLRIRNAGNLALKYEVVITGLTGDAKLLEVIEWTVNGEKLVSAYTGELLPEDGADVVALTIKGHMDEGAGNEYQGLTIEGIGITVYAAQLNHESDSIGPDYDKDSLYVTGSGVFVLKDNILVVDGDGIVDIYGSGEHEDLSGAPAIEKVGSGEMNVDGIDITAGAKNDYAIIIRNGNANFVNSDIHSLGGGFSVVDGASATFESGSLYVDSENTSGRYHFYVVGEGSELTIEGGEFSWNTAKNGKRAYIYAGAGATVYVKGGTFGKPSTRDGYKAGIMGDGTVIITGGTFGFDPSAWVADTHQAVKVGANWIVVSKDVDAIVNNATELQDALNSATGEHTIYVNGDIAGNVTAAQKADTKVTILGNGHEFNGILTVDGKSARYETAGLTIAGLNFVGQVKDADDAYIKLGVSGNNATRYTNHVTVKDCTFSGDGMVAVKSYTGGDKNLTIDGCVVNAGMHSLLQVTNVEEGLTITNCEVYSKNGANLNSTPSLVMTGCTFDVQGYAVRVGTSGAASDKHFAITGCTLKSACADVDDAVIVIRANAVKATLDLTGTTLEGAREIVGNTAETTIIK